MKIVSGRIIGPGKSVEFGGTYLVAPQYGGLIVSDELTFSGTELQRTFRSQNLATINRVPAEHPAASA